MVVEPLGTCSDQWGEPAPVQWEEPWDNLSLGLGYEDGRLCKCWGCPTRENVGARVIKMGASWMSS